MYSKPEIDLYDRSKRGEWNLSIGRAIASEKAQNVMCLFIVKRTELVVGHNNSLKHGLTFRDDRLPAVLIRLINVDGNQSAAGRIEIREEVKRSAIISHYVIGCF